ncbi:Hypothetical protein CINCED_3A021575 [Cinara cedri]|uniref:Uncharacterized protein n=1 Tax=Cinara cedri TaxID=506608 RepID=A0A5E4MMD2_9HEMI|nr:Hypothetical protein CINCED_3A021575 [Cinara cedri]
MREIFRRCEIFRNALEIPNIGAVLSKVLWALCELVPKIQGDIQNDGRRLINRK